METSEREALFEYNRALGWEDEYQKYRENWAMYPKTFFVSEYPLLVDIELSSICNLKCPMCYTITDEFKKKVDTGLMNFSLFKKIIDEIAGKVPAIRLSLRGESTLHPDFINAIEYAKNKGIKEVSTLTNGSMLNSSFVEKMIKAKIDWVTISVDGIDSTYEKIRYPLKFSETFDKIKHIHEIKKQLKTTKPVIKIQSIWPAIRENPEAFYNVFSPYVDFIAFNPLIDYLGNDEEIVYEEGFSCPQLYQRIVVGSDGSVMMCSNDEDNTNVIGDANIQSLKEIWHGEKLNAVRSLHKCKNGFLNINVCKKCYLPRMTEDNEVASVNGLVFIVKNYVNRSQTIGK